jgi:hypothetical protein
MAYIGRQNLGGAYRQLDDISSGFDGSDTTHTMQVNSQNVTVGDVNQIILSLGGVIQNPGTDFTVSGSVLTFTTAPAANTSFFAIILGSDNGGTVTPTDGSVTTGKIVDDAVTAAKVASSGAFAIGATGTSSSLAGIPFFSDTTNGSIYTHDVSGTDSTAARNTAYGLTTLDAITTGDDNTVMGHAAGTALQDGAENVAIGTNSMAAATSAGQNTCVGHNSGAALSSGSLYNVLLGHGAGASMTTGNRNIAIGVSSMDGFDTEAHNLGIGVSALGGSVAGGEYNTAIGNYSLDALTSGDENVCVGYNSGSGITTGAYNNFYGVTSGFLATTGNHNSCFGYQAGYANGSNLTGNGNTFIGNYAGYRIQDGNENTVVGYDAGTLITTGTNNMCLGRDAGGPNSPSSLSTGDHTIVLGDSNITSLICADTSISSSDSRDKTDVENFTHGLNYIEQLRPVTYRWDKRAWYVDKLGRDMTDDDVKNAKPDGSRKKNKVNVGFLAQEVQAIEEALGYKASEESNLVFNDNDGFQYGLKYERLVPMLVNAIKELSAKVKALEEA